MKKYSDKLEGELLSIWQKYSADEVQKQAEFTQDMADWLKIIAYEKRKLETSKRGG